MSSTQPLFAPQTDPGADLQALAVMISRFRYRFVDEKSLQEGIEKVLQRHDIPFAREVTLCASDRPDFLLENGLVIEVKIGGSEMDALRQVARYQKHPQVSGTLLVGTPSWLTRVPQSLNEKPLLGCRLLGSLL